jgi:hypothetical protein
MPSIIPSYVYTLFASMIVGSLLVVTFSLSTVNIKNEAEKQQLTGLSEYVATKSCELLSTIKTNRLAMNLTLNLPSLIGNQRYWVKLENDSYSAWVEVGYGTKPQSTEHRVPVPSDASSSGVFIGGSGSAILECYIQDAATYLKLSGGT